MRQLHERRTSRPRPRRVAVLGGGPAGLTAGLALRRAGVEVDLFEGAAEVGGLARSVALFGGDWPLGPHLFETRDAEARALYVDLAGPDAHVVRARRAVLTRGRRVPYPIAPAGLWSCLPPSTAARCTAGFLTARPGGPAGSAEEAFVGSIGRAAYELLVRPYVEKLQGRAGGQLDAALTRALFGTGSGPRSWAGLARAVRPQPVSFPEPAAGTGALWSRAADRLRSDGGRVHVSDPVLRVALDGDAVVAVETASGTTECDAVLSTLPLPLLLTALGGAAAGLTAPDLAFRNTVLVHLLVPVTPRRQPELWVGLHDPELRTGRVSDLGHVRPQAAPSGTTVLCAELWCDPGDRTWTLPEQALVDLVRSELDAAGLLPGTPLDAAVVRLPRTHPVFALGVGPQLEALAAGLDGVSPGVLRAGRGATFSLGTVGGSMQAGLRAAEELTSGAAAPAAAVRGAA